MKAFLSYRRTDTGGRAGRLFDALASEYGPRNVFHDVTSSSPGSDFVAALDHAIADSDVVLVVIGPDWLGVAADGQRRIDRPDDFVRVEVGAALAADRRVVPVLVDGAELPSAADLPADLAGLVRRQAVTLDDETWHQDVRALIRRLDGELLAPAPRGRRGLIILAAVAAVAVVATVVAMAMDVGDGESGATPRCPERDASWTALDVSAAGSAAYSDPGAGVDFEIVVVGAWSRSSGSPNVLVDAQVTNATESIPGGGDEFYVGLGDFDGLVVDGYDQGDAVCLHTSTDPQLQPDERTVATLGFDSTVDPIGVSVLLETFGDVDLVVSDPAR